MAHQFEGKLKCLGNHARSRLADLKLRLRTRAGLFRRLQILPYAGFGNSKELFLTGRVLKETGLKTPMDDDPVWRNIVATYRRFNTMELPGAVVEARFQECRMQFETDREGYFHARLPCAAQQESGPGWLDISLRLAHPRQSCQVTGQVRVPSPEAEFGIISDIDDTVIVTNAARLSRMLLATFLGNARTRSPFAGVGAFYRALEAGAKTRVGLNPIFYVSSGPWNLYDLLVDFLEINRIPFGPIFLQDYGFDREKFFMKGHREHKAACIAQVMRAYPDLPFILIGDSGQKDPEIYCEVLAQTPNRIRAIYIRHVSNRSRGEEVQALASAVRGHGGELVLVENSFQAGQHAAERGFISPEMLDAIRAEAAEDLPARKRSIPFEG